MRAEVMLKAAARSGCDPTSACSERADQDGSCIERQLMRKLAAEFDPQVLANLRRKRNGRGQPVTVLRAAEKQTFVEFGLAAHNTYFQLLG